MVEILQRDMYFYLNRLVKSHINITPDALLFLEQAQPQDDYFSDLIIKLSYSQDFESHLTLQDIEKIIRENPSMEKYFANKKQIERCLLILPPNMQNNQPESQGSSYKTDPNTLPTKNSKQSNTIENNAKQPILKSDQTESIEKKIDEKKIAEISVQNTLSKDNLSVRTEAAKLQSKPQAQTDNKQNLTAKNKSNNESYPSASDPTLDLIKQIEFELNENNFKENGRFKKITEMKKQVGNANGPKKANEKPPSAQKLILNDTNQNNNQKKPIMGSPTPKAVNPSAKGMDSSAESKAVNPSAKRMDSSAESKAVNPSAKGMESSAESKAVNPSAKGMDTSAIRNEAEKSQQKNRATEPNTNNASEEKTTKNQNGSKSSEDSVKPLKASAEDSIISESAMRSTEKKENKNETVMKINAILELDSNGSSNEQTKTAPENKSANSETSIAEKLKNKLKYLNAKNREGCVADPDSDEINPEEGDESEEEPPACEPVVDIKEVIPGLENLKLNNDIKDEKNKYFESLITKIRSGYSFKPLAKEYDAEIEILKDPTGKLYTDGKVEDFHAVALDKYEKLRKIILQKPGYDDASTIYQIKKLSQDSEVKFIGMVMEKRISNNGTIILTLEDPSSTIKAIIRNGKGNEELIARAIYILEDAVLLIEGFMQINKYDKSKVVFVNNFELPDLENQHEPTFANLDLSICCLSDIHFGSKQHMGHLWDRFVQLLKGELGTEEQRKWAGSIKYITIAGDLVDGIGIYPGQEKNLTHLDIYEQYKYTAQRFAELPDYINIIFVPGDHDPVRKALPSPRIDKDIIQPLLDLPNVTCLGAPSMVSLHGIKTLIYHGESMIDINMLPGMSNENVPKSMKIMLENRHLVPSYGKKTQMAPALEDHLVIDVVPDIFHTGHLHKSGFSVYKGVALVNAGCFQEQTDFMASLGIVPDCGKIPIINIKGPSFKPKIIDLDTQ